MTTRIEPVDALLVVDVGNTRVALSAWDADGLHEVQRVSVSTPDAWDQALDAVWRDHASASRKTAVMGSVQPKAATALQQRIEQRCDLEVLRIRDDVPLPMDLLIDNPGEVGVDRVCAAAAAFERIGEACAVASFGTAITIDCVSNKGEFLGGAILPGFDMAFSTLAQHTALLPNVEYFEPNRAFGRSTHEAIVNGITYGIVGGLREIVERYATELGQWPHLVLTGGNAARVHKVVDFADAVVPNLSLQGVALAYRRAAGQR